jgi:ABC-2 type transport system permease protein
MLADFRTVVWKEWREWLLPANGRRGSVLRHIFLLVVLGVLVPLQLGWDWLDSAAPAIYALWVPAFIVATLTADTFAGERERHTLEAVLATRLPDDALLFGKIASVAGYALGLTVAAVLLGAIAVNLAFGRGQTFEFYPWPVLAGTLVLSALAAGVATEAGVIVSLRAATVKQAQQTLSIALMALIFVPTLALQALPAEWRLRVWQTVSGLDPVPVAIAGGAALLLTNAVLLWVARRRFRRDRLLLV